MELRSNKEIEDIVKLSKKYSNLTKLEIIAKLYDMWIGYKDKKSELLFVYSQIRKHDNTGILKSLFKEKIKVKE